MQHVASLWKDWSEKQHLTGSRAMPDCADPDQMDHWTSYQAHGWRTAYPGESKILTPLQVPGAYLPSPDFDG